jgi:hypothetical protein
MAWLWTVQESTGEVQSWECHRPQSDRLLLYTYKYANYIFNSYSIVFHL